MKKVVITASSKLHDEIENWKNHFLEKGYIVLNYPKQIDKEKFMELYPGVYKDFYESITQTDILFVMNETKNGIQGYIGAQMFAELAFGITQKQVFNKDVELVLLNMPSPEVQCYDEVELWLKQGTIKLYKDLVQAL